MVLAAMLMVALIALAGLAVDVGHAYLVKRQLQAGVDAAALSAAQDIPDAAAVTAAAYAYGPSVGAKNATTTVDKATTQVELKCIRSAPGCSTKRAGSFNAVRVSVQVACRVPG